MCLSGDRIVLWVGPLFLRHCIDVDVFDPFFFVLFVLAQVNSAAEYIGEGNTQLGQALDYRKKARKKWCCIICIVVVVLAAIIALLRWRRSRSCCATSASTRASPTPSQWAS